MCLEVYGRGLKRKLSLGRELEDGWEANLVSRIFGDSFFFKPCAYVICDRKRNITIPETEAPLYSFDSSSLSSFKLFGIALETHKPPSPYNIFPSVVITQNPVGIKEVFQRLLSLDRVHWCFIVTLILSFPFAVSRACVACLLLEEAAFW